MDREDESYRCAPLMPSDAFYLAMGLGVLLVLAASLLGVG